MTLDSPELTLVAVLVALTAARVARAISRRRFLFDAYLGYTWLFFVALVVSEFAGHAIGVWFLAIISFWAIREYFSLVHIRLQDRLALLGAYLTIPCMYYFIMDQWYGMFIVSIPVYGFLIIPLLVALGGRETEGTVFSIGAIDFGLFLFVFCIGHIGYLMAYSTWMAALLALNVLICDLAAHLVQSRLPNAWLAAGLTYLIAAPVVLGLSLAVSNWTGIPHLHSAVLALMMPLLVLMGHHAGTFVERDLGVESDFLTPGRGQILHNLKSLLYAAPVMFHYIRYFLK
jgi:phosphatidate cytidylyltransferase